MADQHISPERNGVRYGLFTAVGMAIYFIVASLLGVADNIMYSYGNIVILGIGACAAISHYKRVRHDRMPYLQGFGTGIITTAVASVAFALFFVLYTVISPSLMEQLRASDLFGFELSVTIAFLAILLQGVMSGVIISLIAMQYFKSPDHNPLQQHVE
ncbi:DUF4199 domain-containing protein [Hymenobacter jeollabukensis]|uniref:DUF4199 domain-containing protein n=1 Tax=Hymenobacter jeollabukensis TaxID=2025313 RepID=A0A5R8WWQ0_9BACT|nr:DUF4199 domain-containing protein [Hymenobacter jeollabukensis]TLM96483.1 DUF4199 domain-containing protein [Hymenobacter jeollabukensis]